jgi:hypothetical protein
MVKKSNKGLVSDKVNDVASEEEDKEEKKDRREFFKDIHNKQTKLKFGKNHRIIHSKKHRPTTDKKKIRDINRLLDKKRDTMPDKIV